jgi:membrane associated rhomboid family serine protease
MVTMGLTPSHPTISNILTSMFVHKDIHHLLFNMLFLWLFGPNVEDALGRLEYGIFYFGSGFAAALMHVAVIQGFVAPTTEAMSTYLSPADIPMVGASGAIAGILGVFAIRFYRTRIRFWYFVIVRWGWFTLPAWIALGIWFFIQLFGGVQGILQPQSGGVAYWSHIGGMIFGMILAAVLKMGLEGTKEYLLSDAKASLAHGTTWDATEHLLSLLKHDPNNAEAHRELARAYALQRNSEEALSHYRKSIELHLQRNEYDQAVEDLIQLKQFYPNSRLDLKPAYQLACYLSESENYVPALLLFEEVADSYPGTQEAETALIKAGDIYLNKLDNPQIALACYERFLREYPDSSCRAMVERSIAKARSQINKRKE